MIVEHVAPVTIYQQHYHHHHVAAEAGARGLGICIVLCNTIVRKGMLYEKQVGREKKEKKKLLWLGGRLSGTEKGIKDGRRGGSCNMFY